MHGAYLSRTLRLVPRICGLLTGGTGPSDKRLGGCGICCQTSLRALLDRGLGGPGERVMAHLKMTLRIAECSVNGVGNTVERLPHSF